jgi:hypothetical protein
LPCLIVPEVLRAAFCPVPSARAVPARQGPHGGRRGLCGRPDRRHRRRPPAGRAPAAQPGDQHRRPGALQPDRRGAPGVPADPHRRPRRRAPARRRRRGQGARAVPGRHPGRGRGHRGLRRERADHRPGAAGGGALRRLGPVRVAGQQRRLPTGGAPGPVRGLPGDAQQHDRPGGRGAQRRTGRTARQRGRDGRVLGPGGDGHLRVGPDHRAGPARGRTGRRRRAGAAGGATDHPAGGGRAQRPHGDGQR